MIEKASVTASSRRAAADVEEVGGLAAVELDDVHRRHGKARAVDEAADVAVEGDVRKAELAGLHLGGFSSVGSNIASMSLWRKAVLVEVELGVDGAMTCRRGVRWRRASR
jgi:hypothetical protein